MSDNEMLNLDEMGCLKESMELLQDELMNNHRIDPNLYVEYDVKRGLRKQKSFVKFPHIIAKNCFISSLLQLLIKQSFRFHILVLYIFL